MAEYEKVLYLTPIHPFTEEQGEVLELLANGLCQKQVAKKLEIDQRSVKDRLYGTDKCRKNGDRINAGIYGTVERITGERQVSTSKLIVGLLGDVLLFEYQRKQSAK